MTNETLADIIGIMRSEPLYNPHGAPALIEANKVLKNYADRIEAAARREREMSKGLSKKLDKNQAIAGNAAAMREALLNARTRFASLALMESEWRTCAESHVHEIAAALAAPARNCDVGTAEEQGDRFAKLCDSYDCCTPCPVKKLWNFKDGHKPSCGVIWAQMPYEEGGAE